MDKDLSAPTPGLAVPQPTGHGNGTGSGRCPGRRAG